MNVFVTGASGYIGRELVKQLLAKGCDVSVLLRGTRDDPFFRQKGISVVRGDLSSREALSRGMTSCEQVYHLAAYARVWSPDPFVYHQVNVEGTCNVLEAARKNGVRKVVFTSTAGVFGPAANGSPVCEHTPRVHPFFNAYEFTKWKAEEVCREYASAYGVPVVIVNPSRVYGAGADTDSNAISRLIRLYCSGKWRFIPGDGKSVGNYVFVNDVVNGHLAAMAHGRPGHRYILGGENVCYNDFFGLLGSLSGLRRKLFHLPMAVMLAFARTELWKARLLNANPVITPEWVKKYLYHWPLSSQKAMSELGYRVTPLSEGLNRTIKQIQA